MASLVTDGEEQLGILLFIIFTTFLMFSPYKGTYSIGRSILSVVGFDDEVIQPGMIEETETPNGIISSRKLSVVASIACLLAE